MLRKILHLFKKTINRVHRFFQLKRVLKHQGELYIGGYTSLSKNTILGKNPNFNGMKIIGFGKVAFGDNFHSGPGCEIITSNHNYDSGTKIPYDDTFITKDVIIGDNVWFGNNVTVLGGVTIGEGAIIQAKALVHKDIPDYAIVGVNPCKIIKSRNIEHYEKLKSDRQFH